jgi:hypothetical protein
MYVRTQTKGTMFLSGIPEMPDREKTKDAKSFLTEGNQGNKDWKDFNRG